MENDDKFVRKTVIDLSLQLDLIIIIFFNFYAKQPRRVEIMKNLSLVKSQART